MSGDTNPTICPLTRTQLELRFPRFSWHPLVSIGPAVRAQLGDVELDEIFRQFSSHEPPKKQNRCIFCVEVHYELQIVGGKLTLNMVCEFLGVTAPNKQGPCLSFV